MDLINNPDFDIETVFMIQSPMSARIAREHWGSDYLEEKGGERGGERGEKMGEKNGGNSNGHRQHGTSTTAVTVKK